LTVLHVLKRHWVCSLSLASSNFDHRGAWATESITCKFTAQARRPSVYTTNHPFGFAARISPD